MQRDIAHDFGLSDLKVSKDDNKSVIDNLRSSQDFSPRWADVPAMTPGWSQRGEKPAAINVASKFGVQADNALARVQAPKMQTNIVGRYSADLPSV